MKKNVLVFPCGSEIGLEIHKSLAYSTHLNLIGASSVNDHGRYAYKNYPGNLPGIEKDNFTSRLNRIIKKMKIDFIFPAHDDVVLKLAYEQKHKKLACRVITSPYGTCKIARSKSATYACFRGMVVMYILLIRKSGIFSLNAELATFGSKTNISYVDLVKKTWKKIIDLF